MTDQAYYDLLFRMRDVLIFLAGEARREKAARIDATVRALRAEARVRCLEIERDYWRKLAQQRLDQLQSKQRIAA